MNRKLDTDKQVFFYEQEFYVLSNFSSFAVEIDGILFPTSEHAYHYHKFNDDTIKHIILAAKSAHDAFKFARQSDVFVRRDWNDVKTSIMKKILIAKIKQHPYVLQKLIETGERELVEDSWRDDYWGWGENRNGQNVLGKLWMEVRSEILKRK